MCLIGHQSFGKDADIYVPVLTILQFIVSSASLLDVPEVSWVTFQFYVGWFKVAQDLMRPFGM